MKVSIVISAYNEESKIEECLKSVEKIAEEIIFVDNTSSDRTVEIAKKYTNKVYVQKNNTMLNVNKNFGFSKASGEWILSLDADERVTDTLSSEILALDANTSFNGYFIPRKNIIFGKWIEHTGWYPDPQLRLFRKLHGKFEERHVHEFVKVSGEIANLKNAILHLNYESVTQFLSKMVTIYTVSESNSILAKGYAYNPLDIVKMPVSEFTKRYFAEKGYMDGFHGLVLSLLQAFYHFVVFLRLWEANKFPEQKDSLKIFHEGGQIVSHEIGYWKSYVALQDEKNPIKKQIVRIRRKIKL